MRCKEKALWMKKFDNGLLLVLCRDLEVEAILMV